MAIYAISDLHLAKSIDKPMDVFGDMWIGYMERLKENWFSLVGENDYVIIPGDISWATYLEQSYEDFKFINELPGKKIILKGNHDYWWTSYKKLNVFLKENGFDSISFIHNNSYKIDNYVLCGTRGWKCPGEDEFSAEDKKVYDRELSRLELSLISADISNNEKVVVAMHYPPFNIKKEFGDFLDIMLKYNVDICLYGHLHSYGIKYAFEGNMKGIEMKLVSADQLRFKPILIK